MRSGFDVKGCDVIGYVSRTPGNWDVTILKAQQVALASAMQHDHITLDRQSEVGPIKLSVMPIAV